MRSAVIWGIASAVVLVFPFAAVCAAIYRFPVPFAGYESGLSAVPHALVSVVFYGLLGGFPLLGGAGTLAGWFAYRGHEKDPERARRRAIIFGGLIALIAVMLLAVLDKLVGNW